MIHYLTSVESIISVIVFILAYVFVILEHPLKLRKSKPVILAAGIIWALVGLAYNLNGEGAEALTQFEDVLFDFAQLFLFLIVAMVFLNTLSAFRVFRALSVKLISMGLNARSIFWITGILAFFISSVADNLTTGLLFGTIISALIIGDDSITSLSKEKRKYLVMAYVNLVVAANAGGAFSPFGDVTTLMIWQANILTFFQFFKIFVPSVINWLIPALIMSLFLPKKIVFHTTIHDSKLYPGAVWVIVLFILAISLAVLFRQLFNMPPVLGMTTGLGILQIYTWWVALRRPGFTDGKNTFYPVMHVKKDGPEEIGEGQFLRMYREEKRFDVYTQLEWVEWDTLMFFYGVVLGVGGLAAFGHLFVLSNTFYIGLGATWANILIGVISSIIDNIPVMYAVINMHPDMPLLQWQLVTLTIGVGGSLLSVGSAPGVALMGKGRGVYTFFAHMKWSWVVLLGYIFSILATFGWDWLTG